MGWRKLAQSSGVGALRHDGLMGHFYDHAEGGPLRLELRSIDGRDFAMLRRLAYQSPDYDEPFVVPADLEEFRTDLASVPGVFTWLVPRSGDFTPAAVLHDAIIYPGQYRGPAVDRHEADRIFREAMIGLGTGRVRAWLMWAAVAIGTLWNSGLRGRVQVVGLLGVVAVIGVLATLDLFDIWNTLPWMGDRPWWGELIGGALGALVIPSVLALTWGRLAGAGVIAAVALAFLLHVTVAVLGIYLLYRAVERVVSGPADARGVRAQDRDEGA